MSGEKVELKPCPFCSYEGTLIDETTVSVVCAQCNSYGPAGEDEDEAVERWNNRQAASTEAKVQGLVDSLTLIGHHLSISDEQSDQMARVAREALSKFRGGV
jgi:Lar family restriction alleviation protein